MAYKIAPDGAYYFGDAFKIDGTNVDVGSDNMSLTDAGLEVSTGSEGDTVAMGCVEDAAGTGLVNGMRGTDDVYIFAGTGKHIYLNSLVLNSSTAGSTKQFAITVDDTGALTATELQ